MFRRLIYIVTLGGLSRRWQVGLYVSVGVLVGMGVVIARVANAMSYLSNAPETCINCHVMTNAYATWKRGSHGRDTVCVDCHLPHTNIVGKTFFKSKDGLKHSYVFTLRKEPQVLRLSEGAGSVVQANCLRCHANQFAMIRLAGAAERKCWHCHTNAHGDARSLSGSPNVLRPQLPDAGLDWMK